MLFPKYYVQNDKIGIEQKIQLTLHQSSAVVIPEVVIDNSKLTKNTFNLNRQGEEFKQKPIETTSVSDKQKEITTKTNYYY